MKAEASTAGANVSQTLTKGACPICGILTGFSVKVKEFVPLRFRTDEGGGLLVVPLSFW
jgi:hypothetical protein